MEDGREGQNYELACIIQGLRRSSHSQSRLRRSNHRRSLCTNISVPIHFRDPFHEPPATSLWRERVLYASALNAMLLKAFGRNADVPRQNGFGWEGAARD